MEFDWLGWQNTSLVWTCFNVQNLFSSFILLQVLETI